MFDLTPYDKWLVLTEKGLRISKNCPKDILEEIEKINGEYKQLGHSEDLLQVE